MFYKMSLHLHVKSEIVSTDLTDANNNFCYITVQRIGEIVDLSHNVVNQVRLVRHALEEQVEIGSATIRFHIQLRQVWLRNNIKIDGKPTISRGKSDALERCSEVLCTPSPRYS